MKLWLFCIIALLVCGRFEVAAQQLDKSEPELSIVIRANEQEQKQSSEISKEKEGSISASPQPKQGNGSGSDNSDQRDRSHREEQHQSPAPQNNRQKQKQPLPRPEGGDENRSAQGEKQKGAKDKAKDKDNHKEKNGEHKQERDKEGESGKKGGSAKKQTPTKTDDDDGDDDNQDLDISEDELENEYYKKVKADKDAGRLPGRMKMIVPPRTVHTPLFELDSVVELSWEYDNNVVKIPRKLTISVQLPKNPGSDPKEKPILYDIASNITGKQKRFFWDTKNDIPEGVGIREGSGYTMYFYDAEIGFRRSDVAPAGHLIKYSMPFAFYISRYDRTNDGVPKNYNPNAAKRATSASLCNVVLSLCLLIALSVL